MSSYSINKNKKTRTFKRAQSSSGTDPGIRVGVFAKLYSLNGSFMRLLAELWVWDYNQGYSYSNALKNKRQIKRQIG